MENLELKDFLDYTFLSDLEIAPDKNNCAFVVHRSDFEDNKYLSNIWIYNFITSKYKKLTTMNQEKKLMWLDNKTILFPSLRDKKLKKRIDEGEDWTVFYGIDINGGEAYEYMRVPMQVSNIERIDQEQFLLTASYDHNSINLHSYKGELMKTVISICYKRGN